MSVLILQPGVSGPSGPRGFEGPKGSSGLSAIDAFGNLDITVPWQTVVEQSGFHGSLTPSNALLWGTGIDEPRVEFSRIGPSGPGGEIGDMGEIGPSGPMGPKGPAGSEPKKTTLINGVLIEEYLLPSCLGSVLVSGSVCIGLSGSTGSLGLVGVSGPSGLIGASGPSGPRGKDMLSSVYCFIKPVGWKSVQNGDSTILTSFDYNETNYNDHSGVSGPRGPMGPRGSNSALGPSGLPGITGLFGVKGPKGSSGLIGDRGSIGDIGPSGPAGRALGLSGPRGQTGPSGPRGWFGPSGPKGFSGPVGLDMSSGLNYSFVYPSENSFENGRELISLCNKNASQTGIFNTIILTPGIYDLNGQNLNLKEGTRIVGFGEADSIRIQSALSSKKIGVLNQEGDDIYLENISIQNTYTGNTNETFCAQDTVFCNFTNTYLSRDPNNNCEFPTCSGAWFTLPALTLNDDFLSNRSAFSNSYINVFNTDSQGNILNIFAKAYTPYNDVCFLNLSENANGKNLILLRKNVLSYGGQDLDSINISGLAADQFYEELLAVNGQTAWKLFARKINSVPAWVLIAANIRYDYINKKILSIQDEEVLLIEKPNILYSVSGQNTFGFSAWPWHISQTHIYSNTLDYYNIEAPFKVKLNLIKNSTFKNVKFLETTGSSIGASNTNYFSLSMQQASYYGGKFINCEAGANSYGGKDGYLVGEFINCKSKNNSFTYPTQIGDMTISGSRLIDCEIKNISDQTLNTFAGFGIQAVDSSQTNLSVQFAQTVYGFSIPIDFPLVKSGIIDGEFRNLVIDDTNTNFSGTRNPNQLLGKVSSGSFITNVQYIK